MENALFGLIITDLTNQKILSANKAAAQIFGYSSDQEFKENFNPIRHFVNPLEREGNISYVKKNGELKSKVQEMKKLDGTSFWVKIFIKLDQRKNIAQTILIDISDQKKQEEPINTLPFFRAFEQAADQNIIFSITDHKGILCHVNQKFCETSKYSANELIGRDHKIVNSGFHTKDFFKNMWRVIGSGNAWHGEIKNKAKDGTFYWVDTMIVPIKNKEEKIINYFSFRTLITEKKQLELENKKKIGALEVLLVLTSLKMKKPLSDCLKQIALYENRDQFNPEKFKEMMFDLKTVALELESFRTAMSHYIRDKNSNSK